MRLRASGDEGASVRQRRRAALSYRLRYTLRACVHFRQRGRPHTASDERGRVAVREFLLFDDEVRDRFLNKPINDWSAIVADLLQQSQTDSRIVGRPMAVSLRNLVKAGTISEAEAKRFMPRAMMEF